MNNFLKRMIYNGKGEISLTKLGGTLVAISGAIIAMPMAAKEAGIVIDIPQSLLIISWITVFVGGKIGVDGARDALDKK